jgi:hypothetical protein
MKDILLALQRQTSAGNVQAIADLRAQAKQLEIVQPTREMEPIHQPKEKDSYSTVVAKGAASKVRIVDNADNQSTHSTGASVQLSTTSSKSSGRSRASTGSRQRGAGRKKTLQERLAEASTNEERAKVLFKDMTGKQTTGIWQTVVKFPFKGNVMEQPTLAMKSAILLATGKNPLQVQVLDKVRGRIFFDSTVHPREEVESQLHRFHLEMEAGTWSAKDIPALASAYLNLGYFKALRAAILPTDRELMIQVLEKAEESVSKTHNKEKRRHQAHIIRMDRLALLSGVQGALMEE